MQKLSILVLMLCSVGILNAQRAVVISEVSTISVLGNTKIVELYNAEENVVDFSGISIQIPNNQQFIVINRVKVNPQTIYSIVFTDKTKSELHPLYEELLPSGKYQIVNQQIEDGPIYLYDSEGNLLDYVKETPLQRTSIILDEENYLVSNSTDEACYSGEYVTDFTPSYTKTDIKIKRKRLISFGYDNSGNRVAQTPNVVYLKKKYPEDSSVEKIQSSQGKLISVYPNPVKTELQLRIVSESQQCRYVLYALSGQKLQEGAIEQPESQSIDMGGYRSGLYVLEVNGLDSRETFKIVKE